MERDLVGLTIANRYEILEALGRGGMGAVYRGYDRELDELIAFKVIRPDRVSSAMVDGFRQEVKLARRVTHVNIARTFELGSFDGQMYCTMELVDGESLRGLLARERWLPVGQAVAIAGALCDGLAVAHAAGVVHRDIKPDNILIAKDGRVVLVDFGVATLAARDDGGLSGTLEYMAPEQARGDLPTPAFDIYSVGLVLYEMLTGLRAFSGTASELLVAKQDTERVTFEIADIMAPDRVPSGMREVIGRATELDPARRIATARELRDLLAPWSSEAAPNEADASTEPSGLPTVVVLAPQVVGADTGSLHIADGIHQELLRRLVSRGRLRVLPRVAGGTIAEDMTEVAFAVEGPRLAVTIRSADRAPIELQLPLDMRSLAAAAETITHAITDASAESVADPDLALELLLCARVEARRGFVGVDAALALLERARALAPDDGRIVSELASILARFRLVRETDYPMVRAFVEDVRAAHSDLAEARIAAGYLAQHLGRPRVAAGEFRAAIALSPYHPGGHEGIGRMLLEAGFLEDATARLDDALAIAPDLSAVRWDLARAHALEQNWLVHDQLVGQLDPKLRVFDRMRFAWWRGDREALVALRRERGPSGFAPEMVAACFGLALGEPWESHRDRLLEEATTVRSPSHRMLGLKAQLAAEAAAFAADVECALEMLERAIGFGLYDLHWFDRCPSLASIRDLPEGIRLRGRIELRAFSVLDALYGEQTVDDP